MFPSSSGTHSRLPLWFLITGVLMFVLFHIGSLVTNAWAGLSPRNPEGWSFAHLMLLGWGTMIAMGAVYQLIFVVVQREIYSERLGKWQYFVFLAGILGLIAGFYKGDVTLIAGFATLVFVGIGLFAFNIAATLFAAGMWNTVTLSALGAIICLVLTGVTGLGMGLNFRFGFLGMGHSQWFGAHLWFGLAGWFGLLITGFSCKMLPMFYLSHGHSEKPQPYILTLWVAAVSIGSLSSLFGLSKWFQLAAFACLAAGFAVFCIQIAFIVRKKHKKTPGSGILVSVGATFLMTGAAAAFLAVAVLNPSVLTDERTYAWLISAYLWAWISPVILGYMSKIVPFLWWTLKYGNRAGEEQTPLLADLIQDRHVRILLYAWLFAALILLGSLAAAPDVIVKTAAMLWSVLSLGYIQIIGRVFGK